MDSPEGSSKVGHLIDAILAVIALLALYVAWQAGKKADKANEIAEKALYWTELSPFSPSLVASDPIWKVQDPPKTDRIRLILVSTLTVSNKGAQPGCIADLVITLQVPLSGDRMNLKAHYFADSSRLLESVRRGRPLHESYEASFAPIVVLGKQQVTKTVVFQNVSFDRTELREGKYVLNVVGNDCDSREKWTPFWKATYLVEAPEVASLLRGQTTVFDSEERINATQSLKNP